MTEHLAEYDPHSNTFLRTFNIRFTNHNKTWEVQIKASGWKDAESILAAIKLNGEVHSELIAYEHSLLHQI